ncbi:MAG: SDR family NAD(P)-dependent oxidoreductase [Anaerolineaceae bacterium]
MQALKQETGNPRVDSSLADLSSLTQVRQLAAEIQSRCSHLDVLINNAGIFSKKRKLSEDGFELTFAVNYLAPFLLTTLLRPLLVGSAPARVVSLSSVAHRYTWLDKNHFQGGSFYWGWVAYSRSKLLLILFSNELASQLKGTGVTSNTLHPGIIPGTHVTKNIGIKIGTSRKTGAEAIVNLAVNPALEGITGAYFSGHKKVNPSPFARDEAIQKRLWQESLIWTGLQPPEPMPSQETFPTDQGNL